MAERPDPLEALLADVTQGAKYRNVAPDLIRRIGRQELERRRSPKEAIEATRAKLHQVAGAYWGGTRYAAWREELRRASATGDAAVFREECREVMRHHASTRERLGILDRYYDTVLGDLAPIRSVLDIACGLHPLAIPWMPLAENATYRAYDIYGDLVAFLHDVMALVPVDGRAEMRDVIAPWEPVPEPADVAFLLKTLPCLEQVDRDAGLRLLETLPARHLVVSFPVHTLGGRRKGMGASYESRFRELVAPLPVAVTRFEFPTELVFRLTREQE
jgi:16S rRNA (guanine(1405)-N(7))-methyltransferase